MIFEGSGVAIVTPFDENDQVDYETYEKLIEFQINHGTNAIIVIGTTGEASTMTEEERIEIIEKTVNLVDGRIKVIAGTGGNNTKEVVRFSEKASKLGVDGLLVVTPYYNKASESGLYEHYIKIADASEVPIIMYTVPGRTGVNIPPETVGKLSKHKNIVGLKDATGDLGYTARVLKLVNEDFYLYSGNDDVTVPLMSLGGKGTISVLANTLPYYTSKMCNAALEGDFKAASELQIKMVNYIDALFKEVNPIPVKAALEIQGYGNGQLRLPLSHAKEETVELLKNEIDKLGL